MSSAQSSAPARTARPARALSNARSRALRAVEAAPARPFEVVESKVRPPQLRPRTVSRTALVNRLRTAPWTPVMTVCAPAGYGKTTLLAQWGARDARPFAWVSADETDNDPLVLLRDIAAAVDPVQPPGQRVVDALRSPGASVWGSAVPRLGSYLRSLTSPFVLVVDDAHLVQSRESLRTLATLADHLRDGSTLVLAGRVTPRLPIAALRAKGLLFELSADELALTRREAQLLLQGAGVELGSAETTELVTRCEGWAAALYLAAVALREERDDVERTRLVRAFRGDHMHVADYVRSEYLSQLRPATLRFLRRTSVLERMSAPLCDATLAGTGSRHELEKIEKSNLFLVPLDDHRGCYRYHALLRDLLRRELEHTEPELLPVLHGRAADWYEANAEPESALAHAAAAGDMERAARILTELALPEYHRGRVDRVEAWLALFDDAALLDRFPGVALQGAWIHALRGRVADAERWLDAAENATASTSALEGTLPDGWESRGSWIALLRAALCRDGVDRMLADGEAAVAELPAQSLLRPFALLVIGAAYTLLGQAARADAMLAEAVAQAARVGAEDTRVLAVSERALIAFERGETATAEELAAEAHRLAEGGNLVGYATSAIALAASARALLRRGSWADAKARLARAEEVGPSSERVVFPWLTIQTQLELARAYLALRDGGTAHAVLSESDAMLETGPRLGIASERVAALHEELEGLRERSRSEASGLSQAELRLLPFLATHLSFAEIGARLYVSRNTIKTQALSIYRRFGVTNRSDAIAEAERLGLIDLTTASCGMVVPDR